MKEPASSEHSKRPGGGVASSVVNWNVASRCPTTPDGPEPMTTGGVGSPISTRTSASPEQVRLTMKPVPHCADPETCTVSFGSSMPVLTPVSPSSNCEPWKLAPWLKRPLPDAVTVIRYGTRA